MPITLTHKEAFADNFITLDQIKEKAPSVFTANVIDRASSKYLLIKTPQIIQNDLMRFNWFPVDAYEVKPKKEENKGFQKHFVRFRNPTKYVGKKNAITIVPEILLVNSYDARCAVKLYIVLYKVVCENKLVVKSDELEAYNMPHKGYEHEERHTDKQLKPIFNNVDTAIALIDKLSAIQLTPQEQRQFAQESCRARWDYRYQLSHPQNLLQPSRPEDEGNDLFTVFNRVQEKLIKGGWVGAGGRKIKAMKDVNRELIINCKLFQILENFYLQILKHKK